MVMCLFELSKLGMSGIGKSCSNLIFCANCGQDTSYDNR